MINRKCLMYTAAAAVELSTIYQPAQQQHAQPLVLPTAAV
jgi:hypothetical protein